jgi:predicted GNAT superfamily acetyltransferase
MGTATPDKCIPGYGPRLWVKFSPVQRFGTPDETKLYRRMCELCCWGGEDRTVYAKPQEEDLTVILSFEFPNVGIRLEDDEQTRNERLNYHRAVDALREAGYVQLVDDLRGSTEFFKGFEN